MALINIKNLILSFPVQVGVRSVAAWGVFTSFSPWNYNKLNSYNQTQNTQPSTQKHLRYLSIRAPKGVWKQWAKEEKRERSEDQCWRPVPGLQEEEEGELDGGLHSLKSCNSPAWVISIFHVAEHSEQGREQGRDQIPRGNSCVSAATDARQKAESGSLATSPDPPTARSRPQHCIWLLEQYRG